jgi:hypothetical protein
MDIAWVVGPFYGWSGTNEKCEVLVAKVSFNGGGEDSYETWGCAIKGSHPSEDNTARYTYRYPLFGGKDRTAIWATCVEGSLPALASDNPVTGVSMGAGDTDTWESYGGPTAMCYTSSMIAIGDPCSAQLPSGAKTCSSLTASD